MSYQNKTDVCFTIPLALVYVDLFLFFVFHSFSVCVFLRFTLSELWLDFACFCGTYIVKFSAIVFHRCNENNVSQQCYLNPGKPAGVTWLESTAFVAAVKAMTCFGASFMQLIWRGVFLSPLNGFYSRLDTICKDIHYLGSRIIKLSIFNLWLEKYLVLNHQPKSRHVYS